MLRYATAAANTFVQMQATYTQGVYKALLHEPNPAFPTHLEYALCEYSRDLTRPHAK